MQIHDPQIEKTLQSKHDEYTTMINDGKVDELVREMYTKDARFFPPDMPAVEGHDGLRRLFNGLREIYSNLEFESVDVYTSGDLAVAAGHFRANVTGPDGKTTEETGKFVEAWRLEGDSWKIFVDTFTNDEER